MICNSCLYCCHFCCCFCLIGNMICGHPNKPIQRSNKKNTMPLACEVTYAPSFRTRICSIFPTTENRENASIICMNSSPSWRKKSICKTSLKAFAIGVELGLVNGLGPVNLKCSQAWQCFFTASNNKLGTLALIKCGANCAHLGLPKLWCNLVAYFSHHSGVSFFPCQDETLFSKS